MSAKGSELKRVRQNLKRSLRNKHYKSAYRTAVKKVLNTTDKVTAEEILPRTLSIIDRVRRKGILHKNKASNQKSRVMKHVSTLK